MRTTMHRGALGFRTTLALLVVLAAAATAQADVLINEIDSDTAGTDVMEFVELYGTPNMALDGYVLVFYNGNGDVSYAAYDLDGYSLDANGFFLLGNAGVVPTPSIIFPSNGLQNGPDAVALYLDDGTSFPNGTPVTATNIVDAIVYGTSDPDATGLLSVLTPGQPQVDENVNGNKDNESCQRAPDGAGGPLVTTGYVVQTPTPGVSNGGAVQQPPQVTNVIHRPLLPTPSESVTVTADATDSDGTVTDVTVYWQVNGGGVNSATMSLVTGTTYSGTIPGYADGDTVSYFVEATDNDGLYGDNPPTGAYSYVVAPETITPIATVHADSLGYAGTKIMVQGQVYIPGNYQADGSSVSAYIQDGSGRGLNIYGTSYSTGMDLLYDTGNIVKVSGEVYWYGTTLEIEYYEVELVSSGNTPLTPATMTTGAAAAPSNEGTYVGATGPITAIGTTGGTNPAHNFTIDDGSGPLVVRIDDDVVAGLDTWLVGDELVAAGAGATYAGAGEILVGLAGDVTNNGQGPDVTPPTLTLAALSDPTVVTLQFSESIDAVTGSTASNYEVYETANPGNATTVQSAVVQVDDTVVVLTLAASISGTPSTVRINNVEDLAGNPIAANTTASISDPGPLPAIVINEIMQNPSVLLDSVGEWFEVYNAGASAVDMNGWTIKDLGTDSHVIDNGGPLVINPGEYKVLGIDAAAMAGEGVTLFYQYAGITLANGADELLLIDTIGRTVDEVDWDGGVVWPDPNGASMQWDGTGDNNDGTHWSGFGPLFGSGDHGTPGAVNEIVTAVETPGPRTALGGNYPNPFNPKTTFSFNLAHDSRVRLAVYDVRGHLVRTIVNATLPAGDYVNAYEWDGRDDRGRSAVSGTYFYRLTTGDGFTESRKMTLLK